MQPTAGLAIEWGLLARSAAACSGAAALERARGAEAPRDTLFKVGVCHVKISTIYGVPLHPTLGVVPRDGWLGPRATVQAKLSNAN